MKRKAIVALLALAGVAIAVIAAPWRTSAVGPDSRGSRVRHYDTTGAWTYRMAFPEYPEMGEMLGCQFISPEVQGRSGSVVRIPNADPSFFGMFPEATTTTDFIGHRVRTGPNSWDAMWIGYGCAAPAVPWVFGEVVYIAIMREKQSCSEDGRVLNEPYIMEVYTADQDTDPMDGFPDAGQEPVYYSEGEVTGYRLPILPLP